MPRLFTAIDVPGEQGEILAGLQTELVGARWEHHLHLTLTFLGEVDDETAEGLTDDLDLLDVQPFLLPFSGLGWFGPDEAPQVVWMGVAPSDGLAELRRQLADSARTRGIELDPRPFRPHVTLARTDRADPEAVRRYLRERTWPPLSPMPVTEVTLLGSRDGGGGRRSVPYRVVARRALA